MVHGAIVNHFITFFPDQMLKSVVNYIRAV